MHIKRIIVSHDASQGGIKLQNIDQFRVRFSKERGGQKQGCDDLQHVKQQHREAGLRAKRSQHICHAGVAAAIVPDIDTLPFSEKISRLKQSESQSDQKAVHSDHDILPCRTCLRRTIDDRQTVASSPLRSRMISLIGVPRKPKVSRS